MIFVGIDVAKNKHDCCIVSSDGTILDDSLRISNSKEGFEFLYSSILSFLPSEDISNVKIGLESTGHYSNNIQNYLYAKGFKLSIFNPLATNLFRKAQTLRKTKTDKTDALDKQIKQVIIEINSPLMTVPGISYTLASIILAEIGDIERFTKPAKLLAFAGLEPSTYQSGKFNATHTPVVKRGSTYLRWAILTSARTVSMRDETFSTYLAKKRSEGKHFYVVMSHVAKKLIRVIFHILKSNTAFVPQM